MAGKLEIEAQLAVSLNGYPFVVVAEENYIIINFKDSKAFDYITKNAAGGPESKPKPTSTTKKTSSGGPLKKLNEVNAIIRQMGLIVDVRVGNKTYVEFGSGNSARITVAAIFGKISSFFSK